MCAAFQSPLGHLRMGLGSGARPYQGVLTICAGPITLCENVFLCFGLYMDPFVLCKCVCVIWDPANLTAVSVSCKEGTGSFVLWHTGVACRPLAPCQLLGGTCWPWGLIFTMRVDLALSLLHVTTALFHLVLDWVVFSLVTPIPRYSG